ncbi:hypothetical protein HanRHA438_Chr16g0787631 [Helianthus annuus]|nr:hypothetical protein HanHA300_Chr16g0633621 [Helianthus annuus]KAJ0445492.1 hypothetical protein HanIR_Chr16g0843531 [Helianthus annuus]KAJ0462569.1 hypothetical protein HanHA89_Chr16g0684801 [Helianthus annuus]KAJ0646831.1 hypothetical protein HanOQP8_Chr16g0639501 [Helianthus annuus]KAJ0823572.1 hypothetical protein HanPSC8_Chr16g0745281 [Helianthus annuus]
MKDVWIGSFKLFIVLVRFVDGEKIQKKAEVVRQQTKDKHHEEEARKGDSKGVGSEVVGGKSFRKGVKKKGPVLNNEEIKIDKNVRAFVNLYEVAVLGRVVDLALLTSLKERLRFAGCSKVDMKYLGGFPVFLVFECSEIRDAFLASNDMWKGYLDKADRWGGQVISYERIAWVKIHGVPFHLALNPVFNVIGNRFRKVVQPAQLSDEDRDFSFVMIGVLCSRSARIEEQITLSWKGVSFSVWLEEERGDWIPECIEDLEEINDNFSESG